MIKYLLTLSLLAEIDCFAQTSFDTKAFGQKILEGKVKFTNENEKEFMRTLDSLFCKNLSDKGFYFKIANKIQQMADGVLGEYFAGTASRYYLEQNVEFINNSATLSHQDIESLARSNRVRHCRQRTKH